MNFSCWFCYEALRKNEVVRGISYTVTYRYVTDCYVTVSEKND